MAEVSGTADQYPGAAAIGFDAPRGNVNKNAAEGAPRSSVQVGAQLLLPLGALAPGSSGLTERGGDDLFWRRLATAGGAGVTSSRRLPLTSRARCVIAVEGNPSLPHGSRNPRRRHSLLFIPLNSFPFITY